MSKTTSALTAATLPLAGTELTYVVQGGNSRSAPTSAYYIPGGTDVVVADGGTGASTASGARTNLGLVIGTDIQAYSANLAAWSAVNPSAYLNTAGIAAAYQPLDADLTAIAALTTTSTGRSLLTIANAAAGFDSLAPTTTRGDLIFRNATTNTRLAASTSGYHLQTNGASTDPTWAGFSQPLSGSPAIRTWNAKASDRADLRDWNGLDMTDTNDMSSLLSSALTAVAGTGDTLWIPAGTMALGSTVNIPAQAKVQGEGAMGSIYGGLAMASQKKTVLHFGHTGVGLLASSAFGAEMRGLTTYRTQPAPGAGWAPTAHDFDIKIVGSADVVVEDITILNGTKGIQLIGDDSVGGTGAGCGRVHLRHIGGQPMTTGIELRNCYDVIWMDEIGFWPYWSNDSNVRAYQRAAATAFRFYRADNPKVGRIFSIGYLRNLAFSLGAAGVNFPASLPGGSCLRGYFDSVGGDSAATTLQIESGASPELVFDKIYGQSGLTWAANSYLLRDSGTNSRVSIGHLDLDLNMAELVYMDGTGGEIKVDRTKISRWDGNATGTVPAFNVTTGNRLNVGVLTKDSTAAPIVTGAGIFESEEWLSFTPTVTAITGTLTTVGTLACRYQRKGKTVRVSFDITITNIGTGTVGLTATLPTGAAAVSPAVGSWINTATNASGVIRVIATGTTANITPFPVANTQRLVGFLEYEVA